MGYDINLNYDTAVKKCPEGYQIVIATDQLIQIDYDFKILPDDFQAKLELLRRRVTGRVQWWKTPSKSGNLHVTIHLLDTTMNVVERIAWQAAFGSDPKREMLGLLRVALGSSPYPVLFFEKEGFIPKVHEIEEEGRMFRGDD